MGIRFFVKKIWGRITAPDELDQRFDNIQREVYRATANGERLWWVPCSPNTKPECQGPNNNDQ